MIEFFGIAACLLAISGAWAMNRRMRVCFYVFGVSNCISLLLHWLAMQEGAEGMVGMMLTDAAFLVLAVEGLVKWKKKDKGI